ncbi:MAG: prepilin-type N-terminal cleavage/methylation domain-containing protein [Pseudomonadales bacterium]|nr:prepilin-type N-terminal cleavage/methylation domain-containing protein [Pseudomonadales bacterium]
MARGFTLIELLVTVAVIGLLAGLAMLQARPDDGQQTLQRSGDALKGAVRLAQTQALADGLVLGLKVTERGYEFHRQDPRDGTWRLLQDRAGLAPQALEASLTLTSLSAAGRPATPTPWAALFYSSGEGTALWLRFEHKASNQQLDLKGDGIALPELQAPESQQPASTRFAALVLNEAAHG